jgi:hypothetical protein
MTTMRRSKGVIDKHAQRAVEHAIRDRYLTRRVASQIKNGTFKGIIRKGWPVSGETE